MAERTRTVARKYWWAGPKPQAGSVNVGGTERWISAIYGGALIGLALSRRRKGFGRLFTMGHGVAMLLRARSGHSMFYDAVGVSSASLGQGAGITIDRSVTVRKSVAECYAFWRDFENLPKFIDHLDSVLLLGSGRSHWDVRGPRDIRVEFDAEVIEDRRNELIAWRSLPGSQIEQSGSVHFATAPGGKGTEVRLKLRYVPPGSVAGFAAAKLISGLTEQQVAEDMHRFKQLIEAGVVPTTVGQPSGEAMKPGTTRVPITTGV